MKQCKVCGIEKPLSEFGKDASKPDGLLYRCKACTKAYVQANRERINTYKQRYAEANRDKVREIQKQYYYSEAGRATQQRFRERHRDEIRERNRIERQKNHERIIRHSRAYQERNRAKINADQQVWRDRNREKHRQRLRTWKHTHPENVKADVHARNAKKRANGGKYTAKQWEALKCFYDYRCLHCGRCEPEIKLEVDHVIPVHLGGSNTIDNLQPLCGFCNRSKGIATTDYRKEERDVR